MVYVSLSWHILIYQNMYSSLSNLPILHSLAPTKIEGLEHDMHKLTNTIPVPYVYFHYIGF